MLLPHASRIPGSVRVRGCTGAIHAAWLGADPAGAGLCPFCLGFRTSCSPNWTVALRFLEAFGEPPGLRSSPKVASRPSRVSLFPVNIIYSERCSQPRGMNLHGSWVLLTQFVQPPFDTSDSRAQGAQ